MLVIKAHNPAYALSQAINKLTDPNVTKTTGSRNGPVVRFNQPVTTVWTDPTNRILWSPVRDCNPFLHLIESAWMLAGRNDLATVKKLAAQMGTYTDDGETLNGAYGYRWRRHFKGDQISALIKELRTNRETRRIVLQMWDGDDDLQSGINGSADIPCNTAIYFDPIDNVLNMTVTNRSNDAVWGAYGANVVHMSVLHEYVCALTGFELGTYYQMSNNLHFYTENEATKRLIGLTDGGNVFSRISYQGESEWQRQTLTEYGRADWDKGEPLFHDLDNEDVDGFIAGLLDERVQAFVDGTSYDKGGPYFMQVVDAMMCGFDVYKREGANPAVEWLENCGVDSQWILAGILWLMRRQSYKIGV